MTKDEDVEDGGLEDTLRRKEGQGGWEDKGEKEEEAAEEMQLDLGSDLKTSASPPIKKKSRSN